MLTFKNIEQLDGLFGIKVEVIQSLMKKHLKFASSIALSVIYEDNAYTFTIGKKDIYAKSAICDIHTKYNISSVSKIITGLLVLKLEELGLLDIDNPISSYIKAQNTNNTKITTRMLLSHTSGLPNAKRSIFIEHDATLEYHVLSELNGILPISDPGKMFYYSNIGINIAGFICELVTGEPFDKLVNKYITNNSLLFRDTGYDIAGNICSGTISIDGKIHRLPDIQNIPSFFPSTQALSSLHDLSQLIYMLLNPNTNSIITRRMIEKMQKQHVIMNYPNEYYCLTLGYMHYRNKNLYFHEGSVTGYFTRIYFIPEMNFGIAILSNSEAPGFIERISHYILKKVSSNSNISDKCISVSDTDFPVLNGSFGNEYMASNGKPIRVKIGITADNYTLEIEDIEKNINWHGYCDKKNANSNTSILFKSCKDEGHSVVVYKNQITNNCCSKLIIDGISYTLVDNHRYSDMNIKILELAKGTYRGILVDGIQTEKCEIKYVSGRLCAVFSDENMFIIFPNGHRCNCFSTKYGMLRFIFDGETIVGFNLGILQKFTKLD